MVFQIKLCCFKEFCHFREVLKSIFCNPFQCLRVHSLLFYHWLPWHYCPVMHGRFVMKRNRLHLQVLSPVIKLMPLTALASANNLQVLHVIWVTTRSSKSRSIFNSYIHLWDVLCWLTRLLTMPFDFCSQSEWSLLPDALLLFIEICEIWEEF